MSDPDIARSLSRTGRTNSAIVLPSIRVGRRTAILYAIVAMAIIVGTVDTVRNFIIDERALLTPRGRERRRTRRREHKRDRACDERSEPRPWKPFNRGWRSLSSCVELDLSLRRRPLGDAGVWRLVGLLWRREYGERGGRLRVLNLQRQGITRRGAGYLARWLSADPIEPEVGGDLVDVDRIPTAAGRSIFINLEGNPVGLLGVKDLERAVDKARMNGVRATIVGGGSSSDHAPDGGRAGSREHTVKVGPIEYSTRKSVEMPPWRLPVPLSARLSRRMRDYPVLPPLRAFLAFCAGVAAGRASIAIPYRLELVRSTGG